MYYLYSFLLGLSLLFYIPSYFVKRRILRKEKLFLKNRFGIGVKFPPHPERALWIHAVSVGEVLSLQHFIKRLKEKHPRWTIYLSTLTSTGFRMAQDKLSGVDFLFFIPFDFRWIIRKYFRMINPDLFVLAESEFWPNLLREGAQRTRGVLLINGRISQESFPRYYRFRALMKKVLSHIRLFLVQTDSDSDRLEKIGVPLSRIEVAGNLKAEVNLPVLNGDKREALKSSLKIPANKIVLLAGSVHKDEDMRIVDAFSQAQKRREELVMIIAPRHMDRVEEINRRCFQHGLETCRRTTIQADSRWTVLILDTMGELASLYAICDAAFLGGSLVPWGGQNLLEPAYYGKPLFFGPHMYNFKALSELFVENGAAQVMQDEKTLSDLLVEITKEEMSDMGTRAKETLQSLRGATDRTLEVLEEMLLTNSGCDS